jgi:hypothetical protein
MTDNPGQSTSRRAAGQGTRRTDAAARAVEALGMRLAGSTYEQIADTLGYADKSGAWRAVEGELKELRQERARDVLDLELARLDALLAGSWAKALDGDHRAVANVLRIQERRAKYLDLDRPVDATEGMTSEERTAWLLEQG